MSVPDPCSPASCRLADAAEFDNAAVRSVKSGKQNADTESGRPKAKQAHVHSGRLGSDVQCMANQEIGRQSPQTSAAGVVTTQPLLVSVTRGANPSAMLRKDQQSLTASTVSHTADNRQDADTVEKKMIELAGQLDQENAASDIVDLIKSLPHKVLCTSPAYRQMIDRMVAEERTRLVAAILKSYPAREFNLLGAAIKTGSVSFLLALVNEGIRFSLSELCEAVTRGDSAICEVLLKTGVRTSPMALNLAAAQGDGRIFQQLLDAGCRPNTQTMEAAVLNGHEAIAEMLFGMNAPMGDEPFTRVLAHPAAVSLLIKVGLRPGTSDISLAIFGADVRILDMLLACLGDERIQAMRPHLSAAISHAIRHGGYPVLCVLQKYALNIDAELRQASLSCAEEGQQQRWYEDFRKTLATALSSQ